MSSEELKPDKSIDIKGFVCPITFVRSKLAIESMNKGQVLEIFTDYEEASKNIPRSMQEQGHESVLVEKLGDKEWRLLVRKGKD